MTATTLDIAYLSGGIEHFGRLTNLRIGRVIKNNENFEFTFSIALQNSPLRDTSQTGLMNGLVHQDRARLPGCFLHFAKISDLWAGQFSRIGFRHKNLQKPWDNLDFQRQVSPGVTIQLKRNRLIRLDSNFLKPFHPGIVPLSVPVKQDS